VQVKERCTKAFDCLAQRDLRDDLRDGLPGWGQFCIDKQLAAALPPGSQIRPVRELIERLLTRGLGLPQAPMLAGEAVPVLA